MFGDADVEAFRVGQFDTNVGDVVKELAFQVAVFIAIVEDPETWSGLNIKRDNWHDDFSFVEVEHGKTGGSFQDNIDIFKRFLDLAAGDVEGKFMIVVSNCVGVETDFEF